MLDMAIITSTHRPLSTVGQEFLEVLVRDFSAYAAQEPE